MSKDNFNLIIIVPARKDSQRIPFKNRMLVEGKSLVERALISGKEIANILCCDYKLVLTTNDEYLLDNTNDFPNFIKIHRPRKLCTSKSKMIDVVSHTLDKYGDENSVVILLQPTTPFRESKRIAKQIKMILKTNINKPLTIVATRLCLEKPAHIYKSINKKLLPLQPEFSGKSLNTQEMENYFVLTGGLYVFWRKYFLEHRKIIHGQIHNFEVKGKFSLDLDTSDDLAQLDKYKLKPKS